VTFPQIRQPVLILQLRDSSWPVYLTLCVPFSFRALEERWINIEERLRLSWTPLLFTWFHFSLSFSNQPESVTIILQAHSALSLKVVIAGYLLYDDIVR
jgi:hypothetical protein